jgi:hypothetical protein
LLSEVLNDLSAVAIYPRSFTITVSGKNEISGFSPMLIKITSACIDSPLVK